MKLVPQQWASLVVISVDAVVVLFGLLTGSALLPRSANLVLVVISIALMMVTLVQMRGGFNFEKPTLPWWVVAVAAIAFFGGIFLFAYPMFAAGQGEMSAAAGQRQSVGLALAFAGLTLAYAGVRHRK